MLLVVPATSSVPPTFYRPPQLYDNYSSRGYYPHYEADQFTLPSYPSDLDFFRQPSAEVLEEYEYQRALDFVVNHRRRQAEKAAAIRRQQYAEVARRRHFAALAAEVDRRQQEFLRLQQARARLLAAERERQDALNTLFQQFKGPQPITRHSHVAKRKPLADELKQRLAAESDTDVTEPLKNILSSLQSPSVESDKPGSSGEDASKFIETLLSSIFPSLATRTQPEPTPSTEQTHPDVSGKGKGNAPAIDIKGPQEPASKPESTDGAFADILRHIMEFSKSTPTRPFPGEAGPSGSSSGKPITTESEQAQIDRTIALSSVERVQDKLTRLRTDFVLPTELDHHTPSADDHDETASASSVSSSDLTKLIPYTSTNKPVYRYENELNGLLEELDRIDSHGDVEVREKRKEVVKAIEKALEGVEHAISEAVEKRGSVISTGTPIDETLKGFDVDEDTTEVAPTQEQAKSAVVNDAVISESPSLVPTVEESILVPTDISTPAGQAVLETDGSTIIDTVTDIPVGQTSPESDIEGSTATITPDSIEFKSRIETELSEPRVQAGAPEIVDTFLLPEKDSPSPVQNARQIDSDTDDEVLVQDSDAEKSDWSELEQ